MPDFMQHRLLECGIGAGIGKLTVSARDGFDTAKLTSGRRYRIAVPASSVATFGRATTMAPRYWVTHVQLSDALARLAEAE